MIPKLSRLLSLGPALLDDVAQKAWNQSAVLPDAARSFSFSVMGASAALFN